MKDLQKLQFNNRTILTASRDSFVAFLPEDTFGRVTYTGSCSKVSSIAVPNSRLQFMVLPKQANNTQLGTCNNGINTSYGIGIFWVDSYTISSDGALHFEGWKGANATSSSSNSGWPTAGDNTRVYYYASQTFGGITTEAHKFGIIVPSNAIAVVLYYRNDGSILTVNSMNTDRTYVDKSSCTCGFGNNTTVGNNIWNLAANARGSYDVAAGNMTYPFSTNKTILCGSKDFLTSL